MKTIYVITDTRPRLRDRARTFAQVVAAAVLAALTFAGAVVALLLGALDALITARVGMPRVAWLVGQIAQLARQEVASDE